MSPVQPVPRAVREFQAIYLVLVLNFLIPAISYVVAPAAAIDTMDRLNRALGGGAWPSREDTHVWHMLAVGNVMTLAWMCWLLLLDVRRYWRVLPALVVLKGFSATYSGFIAAWNDLPAFWGVLLLDGTTTAAMIFFAVRARNALEPEPQRRLAAAGLPAPNRFQILLGTLYMANRILFRPGTIGTSADPVRDTPWARRMHWRALRLPFALAERSVFPLDLSGLELDEEQIVRHLLGAHHDRAQALYDLQLLSTFPGALERLRDAARFVVEHDTARTRWLKDLVVFEGYHARLLRDAEAAIAGTLADDPHPDISLRAWLQWCQDRPATLGEALRTWRAGQWSFAPPALAP
jgi:hypothetical protein